MLKAEVEVSKVLIRYLFGFGLKKHSTFETMPGVSGGANALELDLRSRKPAFYGVEIDADLKGDISISKVRSHEVGSVGKPS